LNILQNLYGFIIAKLYGFIICDAYSGTWWSLVCSCMSTKKICMCMHCMYYPVIGYLVYM